MPNVTPKELPAGKRINIYMRNEVHAAATKRAFELNLSFSSYLAQLILRSQQRTRRSPKA